MYANIFLFIQYFFLTLCQYYYFSDVCNGVDLDRSPYLARQTGDYFFNRRGPQMKGYFSNGSCQTDKREMSFPKERKKNNEREERKKKRRIILRASSGRKNKDEVLQSAHK